MTEEFDDKLREIADSYNSIAIIKKIQMKLKDNEIKSIGINFEDDEDAEIYVDDKLEWFLKTILKDWLKDQVTENQNFIACSIEDACEIIKNNKNEQGTDFKFSDIIDAIIAEGRKNLRWRPGDTCD